VLVTLAYGLAYVVVLQRVGGWSSLALVQRYAHVRAGRDAEAIRAMLDAHDGAAHSERPGSLTAHGRGTLRAA
jgi:hypothetical protein